MKKYFLLINVIVGFSCTSSVDKPEVISSAGMVELLIDIHILEAKVDKLRISNDSSFAVYNTLEKELFERHGVSKEDYENSYKYYLSEPLSLDRIYEVVVDSLNVIQKRGYQYTEEMEKLEEPEDMELIDSLSVQEMQKPTDFRVGVDSAEISVKRKEIEARKSIKTSSQPEISTKSELQDSIIRKKKLLKLSEAKQDSLN